MKIKLGDMNNQWWSVMEHSYPIELWVDNDLGGEYKSKLTAFFPGLEN